MGKEWWEEWGRPLFPFSLLTFICANVLIYLMYEKK